MAFAAGQFNWLYYVLLVIGLVMAHATNNLLNDLTDYSRGVDRDNYYRTQYGPQPLEQGVGLAAGERRPAGRQLRPHPCQKAVPVQAPRPVASR